MRIGEQTVLERLGCCTSRPAKAGQSSGTKWLRMVRSRKSGTEADHAADAAEGWAEVKRRIQAERHQLYILDEFTYPMQWWVDVGDVVETLVHRPGRQHVIVTGRRADPG
ncbi:cob(I)yrinic acid a,c-diamide adenosyltransferase [Micromonospora sp. BRA006-A]|nr:cob(I)yrinic acid a,c-diamide adenosyltransferase [Micromonospora sp. BRA006-A]